jgi:hypothetical protein
MGLDHDGLYSPRAITNWEVFRRAEGNDVVILQDVADVRPARGWPQMR